MVKVDSVVLYMEITMPEIWPMFGLMYNLNHNFKLPSLVYARPNVDSLESNKLKNPVTLEDFMTFPCSLQTLSSLRDIDALIRKLIYKKR